MTCNSVTLIFIRIVPKIDYLPAQKTTDPARKKNIGSMSRGLHQEGEELRGLFALADGLELIGSKEEITKGVKVRFWGLYPTLGTQPSAISTPVIQKLDVTWRQFTPHLNPAVAKPDMPACRNATPACRHG